MPNATTEPSTAAPAKAAPKKNSKANGKNKKPEAKPGDATTKLLQLIAAQWSSELRAVADAVAKPDADLVKIYRRTQKVVDNMRATAKAVRA